MNTWWCLFCVRQFHFSKRTHWRNDNTRNFTLHSFGKFTCYMIHLSDLL